MGNKNKKEVKGQTKNPNPGYPTLKLIEEKEIAMDFAAKVYEKFDKIIKSIILFGSTAKNTTSPGSDIDIIIVIDDASIQWDQELIAWYREELGKIIQANPYKKELHINTVKISTWWQDLMHGDPVVINVLRYGEPLIDFGGFFNPLKFLLIQGKINSTPEAVYNLLERAPLHLARSRAAVLGAVEGLYWSVVDSAHAAIIAAKELPPSPEHIPILLKELFVDKGLLKMKYPVLYRDIYLLHRRIVHGENHVIKGSQIDSLQENVEDFIGKMAEIIKKIT